MITLMEYPVTLKWECNAGNTCGQLILLRHLSVVDFHFLVFAQ